MEDDPLSNPDSAHPRARELMTEPILWDCVNERGLFGSDEGSEAFYEWREWRAENPEAPITDCFNWILDGQLSLYNASLCTDEQISTDLRNPKRAFLAKHFYMYTMDVTILATGLGQLLDEGTIDSTAKPFLRVAIKRQRFEVVGYLEEVTLDAIEKVILES